MQKPFVIRRLFSDCFQHWTFSGLCVNPLMNGPRKEISSAISLNVRSTMPLKPILGFHSAKCTYSGGCLPIFLRQMIPVNIFVAEMGRLSFVFSADNRRLRESIPWLTCRASGSISFGVLTAGLKFSRDIFLGCPDRRKAFRNGSSGRIVERNLV